MHCAQEQYQAEMYCALERDGRQTIRVTRYLNALRGKIIRLRENYVGVSASHAVHYKGTA